MPMWREWRSYRSIGTTQALGRKLWFSVGLGVALVALPVLAGTPPLPRPRPEGLQQAPVVVAPMVPVAPQNAKLPLPPSAPKDSDNDAKARIYQTACPAVIRGEVVAKPLPPIVDGQCGLPSPLSVTGILVNGRMLKLSTPAILGCQMAEMLPGWVSDVDRYVQTQHKTQIKSVLAGESYICRDRRVAGGSDDLSEHGRADALDFTGFALEDGRKLTVEKDYDSADPATKKLMHFAHDAACTSFTTVLGPDANALHRDHFHLDLGCHGKSCTYRLCE